MININFSYSKMINFGNILIIVMQYKPRYVCLSIAIYTQDNNQKNN